MRIPSSARRSVPDAAIEDQNRDGRIDERDDRPVANTGGVRVREQVDDRTATGPATGTAAVPVVDRSSTRTDADIDRAETDRQRVEETRPDADRAVEAPAGPRPRASLLATLGLIMGAVAALFVLSGLLAGYGVALGVAGLLLSVGGLSATGKRHVAGKSDAMLGIVLNIGAMVVGALALTGALPWLTTETDKVDQLRQWLDTQFADRF